MLRVPICMGPLGRNGQSKGDSMAEIGSKGLFITFEGGDGAGKSTHIARLAQACRNLGREVLCLREPGGTAVGEALRGIVLDPVHDAMDPRAELLIYEAARAQIVAEVIRPALGRGAVVLCDRFSDSTVAYQSFGRGLPRTDVEAATEFACQGLVPDRTILLVCGSVTGSLDRATEEREADRLEAAGADFHERVRLGFQAIAEDEPRRVRMISSDGTKDETSAAVFAAVSDLIDGLVFSERS